MILTVDRRRKRVYFGTRLHRLRVHHGSVGVGCVAVGYQTRSRPLSALLMVLGAVLAWDDLPDLKRSWWLRDV